MMEQIFQMVQSDKKTIEKLIADDNVNINHMIPGENLQDGTLELIVVKAPAPGK